MPIASHISTAIAAQSKWAFTTRRVARSHAVTLTADISAAVAGDLVLARVEQLGSHKNIQLPEGRPAELYPNDLVVLACGARYAADQFEGVAELDPAGADLLAAGGLIGRMRSRHDKLPPPTRLAPLGLLTDADGRVVNVARYALAPAPRPTGLPVIGVIGAGMNSGKTTTTASLTRGLTAAGYRVAAIKATGTGAFGDVNAYRDAGADAVIDFTDAGMASTYREPHARIAAALDTLLDAAVRAGCDVAVVELADGVLQAETSALLADPATRGAFAGFLYAVPDPLAAVGGVATLARVGIVPLLLAGLISRSPLAAAEAEAATGLRVFGLEALRDPAEASVLLHRLTAQQRAAA